MKGYPGLFSGVANINPPDRGPLGTAEIKLKPNPKVYQHQEYQLPFEQAKAIKKLLKEVIERGPIEPSDSESESPAFLVRKKEKMEWMLVVDYRGLNEQIEHDSYSPPLINSILQKQAQKRIFTVSDLKHGYHQMPLHEDTRVCTAMSRPLGPMQWKVGSITMDVFATLEVGVDGEVFDCVISGVDRHSGYILAFPGNESQKKDQRDKHGVGLQAKTVAQPMTLLFLTVFDVPAVICSNRGTQFVGAWLRTMCKYMGVRHAKTVASHSRSTRRAEVAGRHLFQ